MGELYSKYLQLSDEWNSNVEYVCLNKVLIFNIEHHGFIAVCERKLVEYTSFYPWMFVLQIFWKFWHHDLWYIRVWCKFFINKYILDRNKQTVESLILSDGLWYFSTKLPDTNELILLLFSLYFHFYLKPDWSIISSDCSIVCCNLRFLYV